MHGILKDVVDSGRSDEDVLLTLSPLQRALARHSESLWRQAHAIAARFPGTDPGDLYHALRCLELEPSERLRRGLSRGRLSH